MGWRITRGNSCDYARTEQSAMAVARGHDFFFALEDKDSLFHKYIKYMSQTLRRNKNA